MKNYLVLFAGIVILLGAACSKKSDSTPSTPLVFTSLDASDTTMVVNGQLTFTAHASGDGISYHWSATYGTFDGSGASVKWTVCHASTFVVTCEVKDSAGNSVKKQRTISVHE